MLSLRRERVEKQNSRGEIVRKEQVTMTKKLNASNKAQAKKPEWPPSKAVLLSNPYKKFPPQETKLVEYMGRKPRQGRQLDYIKEKDLGYLISEVLKRRQQGTTSTDSDVEDVEGSDAEDTNSEEFDDTNSEKSEDGDTNSEESQVESSNSEESEADEAEDEDISSEESQDESSKSEESEADEAEDEDIGSEESEARDINSEESSEEVEDSDDDEPPRPLVDINGSERNLPTGRIFTDIDQCINNSLLKRHLMDFNPERNNLFNERAEIRISRLNNYTPPERHSWIEE